MTWSLKRDRNAVSGKSCCLAWGPAVGNVCCNAGGKRCVCLRVECRGRATATTTLCQWYTANNTSSSTLRRKSSTSLSSVIPIVGAASLSQWETSQVCKCQLTVNHLLLEYTALACTCRKYFYCLFLKQLYCINERLSLYVKLFQLKSLGFTYYMLHF